MINVIDPLAPVTSFPDTKKARKYPNGLLATGGDLSIERLIYAYKKGIFPWYSKNDPILWWTPDPRCILLPKSFHISKSFKKTLKKHNYIIKEDTAFEAVINHCANHNRKEKGTWINENMIQAYMELSDSSFAHSIEIWDDCNLVGGLYGVHIGEIFFGESMFSLVSDASKIALHYLTNKTNIKLIDCQVTSNHMLNMGAHEISRADFESYLHHLIPN